METPKVYLIVDKSNKVIGYCSVNVPDPILIREDEDPALFNKMKKFGASTLFDPEKNHIIGLGLSK